MTGCGDNGLPPRVSLEHRQLKTIPDFLSSVQFERDVLLEGRTMKRLGKFREFGRREAPSVELSHPDYKAW